MKRAASPENDLPDLSPYGGQWVALVRGQVCAVGNSAVETLKLANAQRIKDEPEIVWVPPDENAKTRMENGTNR